MNYSDFMFKAEDGQEIFTACWNPENEEQPKAVVQIAHGMAEHITRYERFAKYLTGNNYIVYGNDHRGHGKTAGKLDNVGYFADENGFEKVVGDMSQLTGVIKKKHSGLPVFLFGHSMGSLLSRHYASLHADQIHGLILSGTMGDPGMLGKIGVMVARLEGAIKGKRAQSPMLDKMSFGSFNNKFKPIRTDFDWLSRDNEEVDKYIADPYCGTIFTTGFWVDFLGGINRAFKQQSLEQVRKDLPIYLFSGAKDPVGNFEKGVEQVCQSYRKTGISDVQLKFYQEGRHEMLNETNREEVFKDVVSWLDSHLP